MVQVGFSVASLVAEGPETDPYLEAKGTYG